jgi:hypothetical protein
MFPHITASKSELIVFTVLPRIMCAPVFSMDACEEAVEVLEGIIFGISYISTDAPTRGGGTVFIYFYNSNLKLAVFFMYFTL